MHFNRQYIFGSRCPRRDELGIKTHVRATRAALMDFDRDHVFAGDQTVECDIVHIGRTFTPGIARRRLERNDAVTHIERTCHFSAIEVHNATIVALGFHAKRGDVGYIRDRECMPKVVGDMTARDQRVLIALGEAQLGSTRRPTGVVKIARGPRRALVGAVVEIAPIRFSRNQSLRRRRRIAGQQEARIDRERMKVIAVIRRILCIISRANRSRGKPVTGHLGTVQIDDGPVVALEVDR